ncbi:unnamed protein product [Rhizoctonia solani]|uniref:Uncharacterized protein n=1 Tax=Rhizoctonia solani TaxID=456999 RepID=A0A8H3GR18_9AGAM|nr:unnamed protein product [Rhizoctonia solani]
MTLWTFDMRSSDSDIEDETDFNFSVSDTLLQPDDVQSTPQKQTEKALEELFGTTDDELDVEYKPNPWSIAKINANARKSAPPTKQQTKVPRKLAYKPTWKPSGLERFWNERRNSPGGSGTQIESSISQPPRARNKTLRDSISEALRRAESVSVNSTEKELEYGESDSVERDHTNCFSSSTADGLVSITLHRSPSDSNTPQCDLHPNPVSQAHGVHGLNAYIPNKHTTMPMVDQIQHTENNGKCPDTPTGLSSEDTYLYEKYMAPNVDSESQLSPNGLRVPAHQVYYEVPGAGLPRTPLWPQLSSYCDILPMGCAPNLLWTGSPELGREWMSQNRVHLAPPYSSSPAKTESEPSPTMQLIASFAAPNPNVLPVVQHSEYSDSDIYREESPILTMPPRSLAVEDLIPNNQLDPGQSYLPHTPKRPSRPTQSKRLAPLPNKPFDRFDSDDKPFWSSLPTPPNLKLRHPSNGIKTSRFQLPASFLGSSPLSGRTLYKPPPRKRTRSGGEEEQVTKWRVTRFG